MTKAEAIANAVIELIELLGTAAFGLALILFIYKAGSAPLTPNQGILPYVCVCGLVLRATAAAVKKK